jgi:hypothetical protein
LADDFLNLMPAFLSLFRLLQAVVVEHAYEIGDRAPDGFCGRLFRSQLSGANR